MNSRKHLFVHTPSSLTHSSLLRSCLPAPAAVRIFWEPESGGIGWQMRELALSLFPVM